MKTIILSAGIAALCATASAAGPVTSAVELPPIPIFSSEAAVQAQVPAAAGSQSAPREAAAYVAKAGASDLYEIQSSQLAQQKASSDAVRTFAQMMIEHHTATTQQVTAAARSAGLNPPPPTLEPKQRAMLDQLNRLEGTEFDAAYLRQQRTAHEEALALHSNYAKSGDHQALRDTATKAVPIIQRHIQQLQSMPSR
jgi:putative membrane protein